MKARKYIIKPKQQTPKKITMKIEERPVETPQNFREVAVKPQRAVVSRNLKQRQAPEIPKSYTTSKVGQPDSAQVGLSENIPCAPVYKTHLDFYHQD